MSNQNMDLLVSLAERLDAAGVGTWDETTPVAEPGTAIVLTRLPETPLRIVCLRTYDSADDPQLSDREIMVQARTRGANPNDASDMADLVYRSLHGISNEIVGSARSVHIVQMYRQSEADIGPDTKGRYERSENYVVNMNSDLSRLE